MYTIKKINIINYLIAFFPLSIIIGNLAVNINVILICILGLIVYGKKTFIIEKKIFQFLIYLFFFYLIFITLINNTPLLEKNDLYKEHLVKSIFFLRFLLLFLIINKLVENSSLNIRLFFFSSAFFSILISFDLMVQVIFGKNLVGYPIIWGRPSSFFGDENIAGGFLQKFILFFIFLFTLIVKPKNYFFIISISFVIFFIPILLSGNRMPALLFILSFIVFSIIEKKFKEIFLLFFLFSLIIFFQIHKPAVKRLDIQIKTFFTDSKDIVTKLPKLFLYNDVNDKNLTSGNSAYIIHFNSGIQVWKKNKIFGKGLKSFPLNCTYAQYQTCNTHPHNYIIEILLDTGIIGLILIYSIFIFSLKNFFKLYLFTNNIKNKFITAPIFLVIFFEFFPLRSTGSFFSTSNATVIFLTLAIFINSEKLKSLYYKK